MKQLIMNTHLTRMALAGLLLGSLSLPALAQNGNADDSTNYNRTYSNSSIANSYSGIDIPSSRREIAAGTQVKVKLMQDLTSESARVGDTVRAQVEGSDSNGLPNGTMFTGRVTAVQPATPKQAGTLRIQFGRGSGVASATLAGKAPSSDKSNYTSIGAGVGALGGFIRKRKLGDAIGGAILGGAAGYGANQLQKHNSSDINLKKGDTFTVKLDRPVTLRTQVVQPY